MALYARLTRLERLIRYVPQPFDKATLIPTLLAMHASSAAFNEATDLEAEWRKISAQLGLDIEPDATVLADVRKISARCANAVVY